jgi:Leucine-rich repeat (LRR) protein
MSIPTAVESIFFAALDKKTTAEQADYLDQACGDDVALRHRVGRLLEAHPRAVDYLARPAIQRDGVALVDPAEDTEGFALASDSERVARAPEARPESVETLADERGDDEDNILELLQPSDKPGSLGRLAHYEVLEVLGKGGFGTVTKAFDEKLHRLVAIKLMSPLLAASSAYRRRFVREARSAASVGQENVVAIYAVEDQPIPYLVMEYVAGQTLQQKLDATGPLGLAEVLRIGREIAVGLAAAHATGLIHRDIKPSNIILEQGGDHVKIADFGLARAVDDASLTHSGLISGTPMYMAPEQALGETIDQRADLFSLGSVLYAMCTGGPPFRAGSTPAVLKRVAEDTPRPIREIAPEVPEWLCDLIARLHAKHFDDRLASAQEVADRLAGHLAELQYPGKVPERPDVMRSGFVEERAKFRQRMNRNRCWTAAAALLLLFFGALGFTEATGVTDFRGTVIRLFTPDGTLVVEVDDPGVSVKIDGSDIVITGTGAREIRLQPGTYAVEASKGGKLVRQELVTVTRDERQVVRISREAPPRTKAVTRSAEESAWERVVAALAAPEQVKAVSARLKELNPGFDSAVVPTIENDVVRELAFNTDDVTDISPVRALTRLRSLKCSGFGDRNSPLTDLSPLSGLPLRTLVLAKGEVFDLSPLKGMPLTEFSCYGTRVNDLSPLKGMKLRTLNCAGLHVSDLSPLRGMPLETLVLSRNAEQLGVLAGMDTLEHLYFEGTTISDLSALKGLKLTTLTMCSNPVSDLSPLKGMKLTFLHCGSTKVSDLSPLRGMPLTHLNCADTKVNDAGLAYLEDCKDLNVLNLNGTQVSDAGLAHLKDIKNLKRLSLQGTGVSDPSPLKDLPLEDIRLTPRNITNQGLDTLRNMKSLKTIGTDWNQAWPAAEFWARYDKGEFKK